MQKDGINQVPEPDANRKQAISSKGTEKKRRKRRAIIWGAVASLLLAAAGFLVSLIHCPILAILCFFLGLVSVAFGLRINLINNGSTHRKANVVWFFIVLLCSALCIWLFILTDKLTASNSIQEWQPPELPEGTKTAYLSIGDANWTIDLKKLTPNHPFVPPEWGANPITVVLKNNRIYVQSDFRSVKSPTNSESTELIDGPRFVDEEVSFQGDRNFSPTVFEVVDQDTNPVWQVIYHHPNFIQVNGVFIAKRPDGKAAIDQNGKQYGPIMIMLSFGTNFECFSFTNTKQAYAAVRGALMRYKSYRQFNYPSYNHKGEYYTGGQQPLSAYQETENSFIEGVSIIVSPYDGAAFWLVWTNKLEEIVRSPIPILMYIRFTNLKSFPCKIDAYSIEIEKSEAWISTKTIDARDGQLFLCANGFQKAALIDSKAISFNSMIENKEIPPNGTVEGWIYFNMGSEPPFGGENWNCRFRMRDESGAEYAQIFKFLNKPLTNNFDVYINKTRERRAHFIFHGQISDIGNLRVVTYGD